MKDKKDFDEFDNVDAFIRKLDNEWFNQKRKELDKLSTSLGVSIEEHLPEELRQMFFGRETSPEEFDEELTESLFLKTYRGKIGKKWMIKCSNDIYKRHRKLDKEDHERVREVVYHLSNEPSGSTLPNAHNPKYLKLMSATKHRIRNVYGADASKVVQYRVPTTTYRILWFSEIIDKSITIIDFGGRDYIGKKLKYGK